MNTKSIGLDEKGILVAFLEGLTAQPADSAFTSIGAIYKDSATLKDAEPTVVDCESEETDEPDDSFSIPGKRTVEFETSDMDPEACHKIWGGQLSEDKSEWSEPDTLPTREVAVMYTTRTGLTTRIGRAKLFSWRDGKLSKTEYSRIKHRLTVCKPKFADVKKFSVKRVSKVSLAESQSAPLAAKIASKPVA